LSKSIDDFKKEPNIKIVVAAYSKSFLEKFSILTNKEKLRIKLHEIVSKMFSDNIELKSINENGEGTDDEGLRGRCSASRKSLVDTRQLWTRRTSGMAQTICL